MRRLMLAVLSCALVGALAPPADAHQGTMQDPACAGISLELGNFPAGSNQVTTTIAVDGVPVAPVVTAFQGATLSTVIPIPAIVGTHVLTYQTSWTVDGGGSTAVQSTTLTCDGTRGASQAPRPHGRHSLRWLCWWRWTHRYR
jgi:hypothetical protein